MLSTLILERTLFESSHTTIAEATLQLQKSVAMMIEVEIDLRAAYDACISAVNSNPALHNIENVQDARESFFQWDQRISTIPHAYTRQAVAILRNTEKSLADSEINSVVNELKTATEKLEELVQKGFGDEELSYMLRGLKVSNSLSTSCTTSPLKNPD